MIPHGDNRFFNAGGVSTRRSKPVGDSVLEQTPIIPVKECLSLGASGVPWNLSCGELQTIGQSMGDKWQLTLIHHFVALSIVDIKNCVIVVVDLNINMKLF